MGHKKLNVCMELEVLVSLKKCTRGIKRKKEEALEMLEKLQNAIYVWIKSQWLNFLVDQMRVVLFTLVITQLVKNVQSNLHIVIFVELLEFLYLKDGLIHIEIENVKKWLEFWLA
jgi:hypothetical protein